MKTMGYSLLCNTNELQDFISDFHSYPVAITNEVSFYRELNMLSYDTNFSAENRKLSDMW